MTKRDTHAHYLSQQILNELLDVYKVRNVRGGNGTSR